MVAGLADALLSPAGAAVVGRVGQSEATADLTTVLEVAVEDLVDQQLGDLRANSLELGKLDGLRLYRVLGRRAMRGCVRRLERFDLLVHQDQPLMLAMDLVLQLRRQNAPIAGTHLVETRQEARLQGHGIADALAMQQPFDPVAVRGALLQQPLALARAPFAILVLRRGNPNHAANPRFAAQVSQKRRISCARSIRSVLAAAPAGSPRCSTHRSRN